MFGETVTQVYFLIPLTLLTTFYPQQEGVFPEASNKSPIAEALRMSLATETWARPGLGLPVREKIPDNPPPGPPQLSSTPAPVKTGEVGLSYSA